MKKSSRKSAAHRPEQAAPMEKRPGWAWGIGLGVAAVVLAAIWFFFFARRFQTAVQAPAQPAALAAANPQTNRVDQKPGPWGGLELQPISLEWPDKFIPDVSLYFQSTNWFFKGYARDQLANLWASGDLTEEQRRWLQDTNHWQSSSQGISLTPPDDLILGLSSQARLRIYSALAPFEENPFQNSPFLFPRQRAHEWFAHSGLSVQTLALVKRLTYQRDPMLCFSDVTVVGHRLSESEKLRFIKALSRVVAVLARLRITPASDISALVKYWGRSGDPNDIFPLLDSLKRTPRGSTIDVSYLLSDFARQRLFTYPNPGDPDAHRQDCFWTALNYFNEKPDDRFLDPNFRMQFLKSNYEHVQSEPTIGDIILVIDTAGTALHAGVFLAADIVFTKNGASPFEPWILMKIADMLSYYETGARLRTTIYRLKNREHS